MLASCMAVRSLAFVIGLHRGSLAIGLPVDISFVIGPTSHETLAIGPTVADGTLANDPTKAGGTLAIGPTVADGTLAIGPTVFDGTLAIGPTVAARTLAIGPIVADGTLAIGPLHGTLPLVQLGAFVHQL